MLKLGVVGVTALSFALAAETSAFAVRLRGDHAVHVGSGWFRGTQASVGSVVSSGADASYYAQRWAYYDPASGKYMGDDGEWRPCPSKQGKSGSSRSFLILDTSIRNNRSKLESSKHHVLRTFPSPARA